MSGAGDHRLLAIGIVLGSIALAHATIAALAFLQDGNRNPARRWLGYLAVSSALICGSMSFTYVSAYWGHDYEWSYRITWQGYLGIPIIYQLTLLHFPTVTRWRVWLVRGMFAFWSVVLVLVMFTNLIEHAPQSFLPYQKTPLPYENPVRFVATLSLVWIIIELIRAHRNLVAVRRHKSSFFLIGLVIYAGGAIFNAGILQNLVGLKMDPGLVGVFSLPWVAITYYAVTRQRLFDLRMALSRLLSLVFVSIATATLTVLIMHPLKPFGRESVAVFVAVILASAIIFASQLFRLTNTLLQGILFRQSYDIEVVLRRAAEITVSLVNVDEIERRFAKLMRETIGVETIHFFLRDTAVANPSGSTELIEWFTQYRATYVKEERELDENSAQTIAVGTFLTGLGGEVAIPAFYQQRLLGFIVLGAKRDGEAFSERDVQLLETLLYQIALAIENARLFAEATTDGLTSLYHQKYLKARLKSEFEKAKATGKSLGVIIVDVDFFKKVNDNFGHLVGDDVLREVAAILRTSFKAEDVVARYGGEEFVVLLLDPPAQHVYDIAERIRHKVAAHTFVQNIPVTVSAGLHYFLSSDQVNSELDLLAKADTALYAAKHGGRNRVVVWSPKVN